MLLSFLHTNTCTSTHKSWNQVKKTRCKNS